MERKIREIYNLESFKEGENGKLKIELLIGISELAEELGVNLDSSSFDEYLTEMYSFVGELTKVFKKILRKENIMIYSEHGKVIIGN